MTVFWPITQKAEFEIEIVGEIPITILVFRLYYFHEKIMTNFLKIKKKKKKTIWGHSGPFFHKFEQNPELTDRQTDRQTDRYRQTD